MPWAERTNSFKGTSAEIVDVYEDWEFATRPSGPQIPELQLWQPVYVRLTQSGGGYSAHAQALLDLLTAAPTDIAMGSDSQRNLKRLIAHEAAGDDPDPLQYLFLYRPERASYDPLTSTAGAPLYDVLHVGTAIPEAFVVTNPPGGPATAPQENPARPEIVLTAVIDDSIAIANDRFRASPTTTRVARFWMQALEAFDTGPTGATTVAIGQEFDAAQIDGLLAQAPSEDSFYRALRAAAEANARGTKAGRFAEPGYRRPIGPLDTHGTHVMDLAGGRPIDTVETAARPLVAVEVPPLATLDTSGGHLASYVLQAVHRILHWADTWPDPRGNGAVRVSVVINFSYGISAGPKNGQGFLEREIARLVDARNAEGLTTKVVVPAGNNYRDQLTGGVTVPFGETAAFDWCVIPADQSVSFLELRAPQGSPFTLTLTPPDGASVTVAVPAAGGASVHEWTKDGTTLGAIYVQPAPATSGMVLVTVALGPTIAFDGRARTPAGAYRIAVANTAPGPDEIALTLWVDVQRDDTPSGYPIYGRQSYLDDQGVAAVDPVLKSWDAPGPASAVQRAGTMSAFATSASDHIFAVGGAYPDDNSYDNDDPDLREPTWYTSAGPTRDPGARDPALAAISEEGRGLYGVLAAGTYSGSVSAVSGTSAAAPQVTRGIVDILTANPAASRADILQGLLGQGMFPAPDPRLGAGVLPDPPKAEQRPLRRRYP